jgi:hypothetical protein
MDDTRPNAKDSTSLWIDIGAAVFLVALIVSAVVVRELRLLHFFQGLIYIAIIILARRSSSWGRGGIRYWACVECAQSLHHASHPGGCGRLLVFAASWPRRTDCTDDGDFGRNRAFHPHCRQPLSGCTSQSRA